MPSVRLIGVEAGGHGIRPGAHAARFAGGSSGVLQGTRSYVLQDDDGNIELTHSISAGLDYAAVGPEHAWLHDSARAEYTWIDDSDALAAFQRLAREEGILAALESSHAIAHVCRLAPEMGRDEVLLVNLSGRGDKDVLSVQKILDTAAAEARVPLMSRIQEAFAGHAAAAAHHLQHGRRSGWRHVRADPHRAGARRRSGARGRRALFGSACRRPVIQRATERALAAGMTLRGTLDLVRTGTRGGGHAHRALHVREPRRPHGSRRVCADGQGGRRRRRADSGLSGGRGRTVARADGGGRARPDLPDQPDDDRRTYPAIGRARSRVSVRDFPVGSDGCARPAGGRHCRHSWRACARSRRCPWRVGFGISSPEQVAEACASADAAVVGSALVSVIAEHGKSGDVAERAGDYVRWLKSAV